VSPFTLTLTVAVAVADDTLAVNVQVPEQQIEVLDALAARARTAAAPA